MTRLLRTATVEQIMELRPCFWGWPLRRVQKLFGTRKRLGLKDLSAIPIDDLHYRDRVWLLTQPEFSSERDVDAFDTWAATATAGADYRAQYRWLRRAIDRRIQQER